MLLGTGTPVFHFHSKYFTTQLCPQPGLLIFVEEDTQLLLEHLLLQAMLVNNKSRTLAQHPAGVQQRVLHPPLLHPAGGRQGTESTAPLRGAQDGVGLLSLSGKSLGQPEMHI